MESEDTVLSEIEGISDLRERASALLWHRVNGQSALGYMLIRSVRNEGPLGSLLQFLIRPLPAEPRQQENHRAAVGLINLLRALAEAEDEPGESSSADLHVRSSRALSCSSVRAGGASVKVSGGSR